MEEPTTSQEKNENILKEELIDKNNETTNKVTWIGKPAVTLIRQYYCPKCNKVNSLHLLRTIMTNPMQYEYLCESCAHTVITNEPVTSIVYVDKEIYEKEVEQTGTYTVKGEFK